ncbi:hypothetical protein I4U23_008363 [Adineta vaga]|nr:hypothetical protein I4U23_008363 [Adineta vaga]
MIYNHFPKDDKWQLLKTSISIEQYLHMPTVSLRYFDLNLELVGPRYLTHVSLVKGQSYALVFLRAPSNVHLFTFSKLKDNSIIVISLQQMWVNIEFLPSLNDQVPSLTLNVDILPQNSGIYSLT